MNLSGYEADVVERSGSPRSRTRAGTTVDIAVERRNAKRR